MENLGKTRASRISPARSAFDLGLVVNFHQDSPVIEPNMLKTISSAVNRKTKSGKILGEDQRVSVYEALKALTINAAYQYFEEDLKGSLEEGKLADLVILDKDPLKTQTNQIEDIKVLETIKEGQTIYRA